MILPSSDGTFSKIGSVHVCWSVLYLGLLFGDEDFNIMRCFVVQFVELRTISSHSEVSVDFVICF